MVEGSSDKKFNIKLHIKMLRIKVSQQTPVYVIWSRGQKTAKTKSRLLSESMDIAALDEKFEISTVLQCDEEGKPVKAKMSKLSIMGKVTGQLGETELDMTKFGIEVVNVVRLSLEKCADPDAYIEVGLQAEELPYDGSEARKSLVGATTPRNNNMSA